jgi:hypothetical protein
MFILKDPDKFEPSASQILNANASLGGRGYFSAKQNPTRTELKNGYYKPRLTLTNRYNHTGRREASLKIELSLPKLLFGNNFDELTNKDFDSVTELLQARLKEMGVLVFTPLLEVAPVSAIHYSKNIPLTDGTTPHFLISKIKEANIKLSLDVNQTDYRNDGHSYKWHANSYEVAFYDKLRDYETAKKSEKRAIEKDNAIQLNLFEKLEKRQRFEVLRIEVRLNRRHKIRQLFKKLDIHCEPTYKEIFNPKIAQKVLIHYLDELEERRLPLFDYKPRNSKSLLTDLIINNPNLGVLKTIQLYGLKQVFDEVPPRELRQMFNGYSQRSWYRLVAEAKKVKLPNTPSPLEIIRKSLIYFEPLRLVDFQDLMLNNDKYN